jgi:23S rRNA (cytidine1920-2'-O)/16S rRNA (cytidine1409-2'-O)-methyltransferase
VALVERGLVATRARAQAAVMAGRVRVEGRPAAKPGMQVDEAADIALLPGREYVSRAGHKLANALEALDVDVTGASVLDVGASTGGFTDCLLRRGARRVIALDVGYGQLDWGLRNDERVTVMERMNARDLEPGELPWLPDFATVDVSFIGVRLVWPAVRACLAEGWRALIMVKPQFELEPAAVESGGVVREPRLRAEAVHRAARAVIASGGGVLGIVDSGLPGPKGNREIFILAADAPGLSDDEIDDRVAAAVEVGLQPA